MEKTTIYVGYAADNKLTPTPLDSGVQELEGYMQRYNTSYPTLTLPEHDNDRQDAYKNLKRRKMLAAIVGEVKDGKRNDANMVSRTVLPLDLDSISESITDRESLSERLSALLGAKMYIFPSLGCGYRSKGLRYHVWVPLSRPVQKTEYQLLISYYNQLFKDSGIITQIDRSNKSWSQLNGLPTMTQYTPEADRASLVLTVPGDLLAVDAALKPAQQQAVKDIKPQQQVDKAAANQYLKGKKALDVVTDFAKRNADWLSSYNNFLGAYFALKGAEKVGQLTHDEALACVRALAGDDTSMAQANENKYEHDHTDYQAGKGLAWFVQLSQVKAQCSWIVTTKSGRAYADSAALGDEIMKQYPIRYNADLIGNKGGIWLKKHWKFVAVDSSIRGIADQMAKKAGVWTRSLAQDTLRYIKDNNAAAQWESNKFDSSNPRLVQFKNGTLNIDTMKLEESKPSNLVPVYFNYTWDQNLTQPERFCQHWQEMIAELTGDDGDAVNAIYRYIGYAFERTYRHQKFIVLLGEGNNGKSYFINLLKNLVFGTENVSAVSLDRLANDADRFSSSLLYHKSVNLFSDISSNFLQSTAAVKRLTGDDTTTAEYKGQTGFEFLSYAKLLFSANELPTFKDDSKGFSRRPLIVEFTQDFDDKVTFMHFQQRYPKKTLKSEAQAFRQFCITEYHRYMNDKQCFPESPQMKAKRQEWFSLSNATGNFFEDITEYSDLTKENNGGETPILLYQVYQVWAKKNGVKALSRPKFEKKLQSQYKGAVKKRVRQSNGTQTRRWCGVQLSDDGLEFISSAVPMLFEPQDLHSLYGYYTWQQKQA